MPGRSFLMSITVPFSLTQETLSLAHSADPAHRIRDKFESKKFVVKMTFQILRWKTIFFNLEHVSDY